MRHARVGLILAAIGALGLGLWAEGCLFAPDNCTDLLVCPPKGAGGETGTATSATGSTGSMGCTGDGDCDMPTNDGCTAAMCNGSFCVRRDTAGVLADTQIPNDCMKSVCGADGLPAMESDPNDVPADDANVCTTKLCVGGAPTLTPVKSGTACPNGTCDGAGVCANCTKNADCTTGTSPTCDMASHTCISCSDGIQNGTETGPDCGGSCNACNGLMCLSASACASGNCVDGRCCDTLCAGTCMVCNFSAAVGTCTNTPRGGLDSITCADPTQACDGAGACKKASGQTCKQDLECGSGVCFAGFCRVHTGDNCTEDVACGSGRCVIGKCADCVSGVDCMSATCAAPTCKAPGGAPCEVDLDCAGNSCQFGFCQRPNNSSCSVGADCLSRFCSNGVCAPCAGNFSCPSSTCGTAVMLGYAVCKLPKDAFCSAALPPALSCNSGACTGFPEKCK